MNKKIGIAAFVALAEATNPGTIDAVFPSNPDRGVPGVSIGQLRYGRVPEPTGMVRIRTWRKGAWRTGEPVNWADVRWKRLMDRDRVETIKNGTDDV